MQPIFRDTSQAVHFAFVIEQYPVGPRSSLASAVRAAMLEVGESRSGIDFGGLSPLEIHAECQRITKALNDRLQRHEAAALIAKFSHDQQQKDVAIKNIATHIAPALLGAINDRQLLFKVVERHYIPDDQRGPQWSLRALATEFKVSKDRLHRVTKVLEQYAQQLEILALSNLRRAFEEQELVGALLS